MTRVGSKHKFNSSRLARLEKKLARLGPGRKKQARYTSTRNEKRKKLKSLICAEYICFETSRGVSSPFFPARAEPSQFFFEPSEPRAIKSLLRAYTSQKFYHSSLIHASKIFAKNQTAKKMGPIIDQDLASNGRNFYKFILLVNYFRNLDYILRTIVTVRAY